MIKSPYEMALKFIGIEEVPGKNDNPLILSMLRLNLTWPEHDEVPWCSAFVNFVCHFCGVETTDSLRARSWLKAGKSVPLEDARPGFDIVVFTRGSWRPGKEVIKAPGHVGFFSGSHGNIIECLGGNQSNQVKISNYDTSRLLDVRRVS